jgi:hypothetical protein
MTNLRPVAATAAALAFLAIAARVPALAANLGPGPVAAQRMQPASVALRPAAKPKTVSTSRDLGQCFDKRDAVPSPCGEQTGAPFHGFSSAALLPRLVPKW